jgi:hypothetical protein
METSPALKQDQEEEERNIRKVPDLQLITGGKGPPNENWIVDLDIGTIFLYRTKDKLHPNDVGVSRAEVVHKYNTSTLLHDNLNQEQNYIVNNVLFSRAMKLLEVLERGNEQEEF